ncbi:hypothetical protein OG2516_17640 [Oceanicola granulosus HTCC2516]|uniref:DUF6647 domain-containing protein n=1 Tax=Oceanicola granulosus (strain ATCC BAA-861 / DSM 15982 / KCTC 12143 / HTCC2516) TaxID=314256 RepID=Q2CF52_OCEGH|nr:DUF6647 family protein [Oceanicola granulosus]EAR51275.1 hypothetical protein OG2516_17640 [Oceanicola granulosus HTCC2516]
MRPLSTFAALFLATAQASAEPEVAGLQSPHERGTILSLVDELDHWLDLHTDLPRAATPLARVELVPPGAELLLEGRTTTLDHTVRGVYDEQSATIYLVRQWYGDTTRDRSVLLHEMVHHRQAEAQHWYCPQAMEWDAYLLQEDYLNAHGETGGFNWAWVLLASSCAARDHHPD